MPACTPCARKQEGMAPRPEAGTLGWQPDILHLVLAAVWLRTAAFPSLRAKLVQLKWPGVAAQCCYLVGTDLGAYTRGDRGASGWGGASRLAPWAQLACLAQSPGWLSPGLGPAPGFPALLQQPGTKCSMTDPYPVSARAWRGASP